MPSEIRLVWNSERKHSERFFSETDLTFRTFNMKRAPRDMTVNIITYSRQWNDLCYHGRGSHIAGQCIFKEEIFRQDFLCGHIKKVCCFD